MNVSVLHSYAARVGVEPASLFVACCRREGVDVVLVLDAHEELQGQSYTWRPSFLKAGLALGGIPCARVPSAWPGSEEEKVALKRILADSLACVVYEAPGALASFSSALGASFSPFFEAPVPALELLFWRSQQGTLEKDDGPGPRASRSSWKTRSRGKKKTWDDVARELEEGA